MISMSLIDISGADYHCIFNGINKSETINLMQNTDMTEKKRSIIKHKNLLSDTIMGKEILTFDDIEIEKDKFYYYKTPILSNKIFSGEKHYKYFTGYLYDDYEIKPCI